MEPEIVSSKSPEMDDVTESANGPAHPMKAKKEMMQIWLGN